MVRKCWSLCTRRSPLRPNGALQTSHRCGFYRKCAWMRALIPLADPRKRWHKLHSKDVSIWWIFMWVFIPFLCLNAFIQWLHLNILIAICNNQCSFRFLLSENIFVVNITGKGPFSSMRFHVILQGVDSSECFVA